MSGKFKFKGRFLAEIKRGKVQMPRCFLASLANEKIHLVVDQGNCLRLIPGDETVRQNIEEEIKEIARVNPKARLTYIGSTKLSKTSSIIISKKIRKLTGLCGNEVVVVGLFRTIEIWDRKRLKEEIKRFDEDFAGIKKNLDEVLR